VTGDKDLKILIFEVSSLEALLRFRITRKTPSPWA
jgi:hypothetical protein